LPSSCSARNAQRSAKPKRRMIEAMNSAASAELSSSSCDISIEGVRAWVST
jgi:hypothetical protein